MRFIRRYLSSILLTITGASSLLAQKVELEDNYYDFVNYDKNRITMGTDSCLRHFFASLDTLVETQDSKVSIVHIGDSHVQADFISNAIRQRFQKELYFSNGGRGFLFPMAMAKTNNPPFFKTKYKGTWEGKRNSISRDVSNWGVSGVTSETKDSTATFHIELNANPKAELQYESNYVRVYYPIKDSSSYQVRLNIGEQIIYPDTTSHSDHYVAFKLDSNYKTFDFVLEKTDSLQTHFLLQGLYFGNNDPGIVYHSIGVNGAKVDSYLRCKQFTEHLATLDADLVIVSLGTNDAYHYTFYPEHYRNVYNQLIAKIKLAAPHASILLTGPGDNMRRRWKTNLNNAKATKVLHELGKQYNCAIWDFYEIMGGLKSINKWVGFGLGKRDFLHLTANGYLLQGELFFRALILDKYFGERQNVFKN